MTNTLRASFLSTLSAIFLSVGSHQGDFADGRGDWDGYAWQTIDIANCTTSDSTLLCPPYHERWDWKRDQWVDVTVTLDLAGGALRLTQRLTDNDSGDRDDVCVTALAVDADGRNIVAHHQNWRMGPGAVEERGFSYPSPALRDVTSIHIGSKQCRDGSHEDDALYARVLAGIAP